MVSLLLHVAAVAAIAVVARESPEHVPAASERIAPSTRPVSNVAVSPEPAATAPADVPPPAFATIESTPRTTPGVSVSMVASSPPPKPPNKTKAAPAPVPRHDEATMAAATAPVAEPGDRPATVEAASPAASTVAARPTYASTRSAPWSGAARRDRPWLTDLRQQMVALDRWRGEIGNRPRVLFLLSVGQGPLLTGARNTPADPMIRLAGGINAAEAS